MHLEPAEGYYSGEFQVPRRCKCQEFVQNLPFSPQIGHEHPPSFVAQSDQLLNGSSLRATARLSSLVFGIAPGWARMVSR